MSGAASVRCDGERLSESIAALAAVGGTPAGGCSRPALTEADRAGHDLFARWAQEAGLSVRADAVGNLFARRNGTASDRPAVMLGSHLDTVPDGGRYDGAYGVLAALETVRALNDAGIRTRAPIELAVWANEEGARFPQVCTGSAAFAGLISVADLRALRALDGPSYGEELDRTGMAGPEAPGSSLPGAYLEAHIEQGPLLDRAGIPVGIVTGIRAVRYFEVTLSGEEAHVGSVMEGRRDALRAAAAVIERVHSMCATELPEAIVGVGRLEIEPNAPTVVAGGVRAWVCVRPAGVQPPAGWEQRLELAIVTAAAALGVSADVTQVSRYGPVEFDDACVTALRGSAAALGLDPPLMVSNAGHDAGYLAGVAPTAMVFVACRGGVSHSPREFAAPADLAAGCDVLLATTLALAERA